jgi:hypothetical protein
MIGAVAMISVLRPSLPQKQLDRAETITDVLDADCGLLAALDQPRTNRADAARPAVIVFRSFSAAGKEDLHGRASVLSRNQKVCSDMCHVGVFDRPSLEHGRSILTRRIENCIIACQGAHT